MRRDGMEETMKNKVTLFFKHISLVLCFMSLAQAVFAEEESHAPLGEKEPKKGMNLEGSKIVVLQAIDKKAAAKRIFNLDELIKISLQRNPGLRAVEKGIDISGQGILAAKGERFGRIDFDVSDFTYGTNNIPRLGKSTVVDQILTNSPPRREFNNNLFSFGGRISIPLYTGGRITNQIRVEELKKKLAFNRLAQSRDELIFNVASVYYNILKFKDFVRAAEKSKEQLLESKRVIGKQFEAGKVAKVDTLKVNTRLAAVEQVLIKFLNIQNILYGLLNILLGEDAGNPKILIHGDLRSPSREKILLSNISEVYEQALQRQPELLALQKEMEIQEKQIRIAHAERLPNIELSGNAQGVTGERSGIFPQVFGGIFLSVPLFTGGVIEAKVKKERIRYHRLRDEVIQLKLKISQEVQEAYLNGLEAQHRIEAAQAAVDEALEVLRIEALKVREGKSVIENLLDAQAAQLQAEQNLSAAVADYQIQIMALKRAIGLIEVGG